MSRKFAILFLVLTSVCSPVYAAKHTWLGTTNNLISEPTNWSGGSPVGDPVAEISVSDSAARRDIVNDVPGLPFKAITFQWSGFTLSGESLSATSADIGGSGAVIECDVVVSQELRIGASDFRGTISGSGRVVADGHFGRVTFSGTKKHTYLGDTIVTDGFLYLGKSGVAAIPGNLILDGGDATVGAPEQIPNTATVDIRQRGSLWLDANETIAQLILNSDEFAVIGKPDSVTLTVQTLKITTTAGIEPLLRLGDSSIDIPAGATLSVTRGEIPVGGLTLRGAGTVYWTGTGTSPIVVDGVSAQVIAPNSPLTLKNGRISYADVQSLTAAAGTIESIVSASDIRLNSGVTLSSVIGAPLKLNGTFDAGNATLIVREFTEPAPKVIVNNASNRAVSGTFAGIPEGGIVSNFGAVTYRGGDGNDVAVTPLGKSVPSIAFDFTPKPAYFHEPVTVTATVTASGSGPLPTGTVTFFDYTNGSELLGTVALTGGKASVTATLSKLTSSVTVRYSGDAAYAPLAKTFGVAHERRAPVVSSVEPGFGVTGTKVPVIIRGSYFEPEMLVRWGGHPIFPTTFVSSTELRGTFDLTNILPQTVDVVVHRIDGLQQSNAMPFTITAAGDPNAMLSFEPAGVVGKITPGGTAALIKAQPTVMTDDDHDGVVRWSFASLPQENFGIVDLATGEFEVRKPYSDITSKPFPEVSFVADASGLVTHLNLNSSGLRSVIFHVLWVRPGVGAWSKMIEDGKDDDGTLNGWFVTSLSAMTSLGAAPMPANGPQPGDVVLALNASGGPAFAEKLEPGFVSTSPGILSAYATSVRTEEGWGSAKLQVARTEGASGTVSVRYTTAPAGAIPGQDYVHTTGTLTFGPAETTKWIEVPVLDDAVYDGSVAFHVLLSDPGNATLGSSTTFVVTIYDNDKAPECAYSGPKERHILEGDAPTSYPLDLTLTGTPSVIPIVVEWYISGEPGKSSITFAPGERTKSIAIPIPGDDVYIGGRQIIVRFAPAGSVRMTESFATLIIDEDDVPVVTIADVSVDEKGGPAHVTIATDVGASFAVSYETAPLTATAGADFTTTKGTVNFAWTDKQKTITIPIINDSNVEGDEQFTIAISATQPARVDRNTATVTIVDDDQPARPKITIADTTILEGDQGTVYASFAVQLDRAATLPVTVFYATGDGSATAGADYEAKNASIEIAAGATSATIIVPVIGDVLDEPDEDFSLVLDHALNAEIARKSAHAVIVDDDESTVPRITISDTTVQEGDQGTAYASFAVQLDRAATVPVKIFYTTRDGSALAGADYEAKDASIEIAAGATSATIVVPVIGDVTDESDEDFTLLLDHALNGTIARKSARAVIVDDDVTRTKRRAMRR